MRRGFAQLVFVGSVLVGALAGCGSATSGTAALRPTPPGRGPSLTNSARDGQVSAPSAAQLRIAEAIARSEGRKYGRHVTAGAAYVTKGIEADPNIGPACESGTLLNVVLLGSFPHDVISAPAPLPGQKQRDLTVRALLITADGVSGKPCLFGDGIGRRALLPAWTRLSVS